MVKSGKRRNLADTVQLFLCRHCRRKFSHRPSPHITYPIHAIIETLSLYNRGYTLEESARRAGKRHHLSISKQLAATWKDRYADRFPYFRIRDAIASACAPHSLILSARLHHGQVYDFSYHWGKTEHLLARNAPQSPLHDQGKGRTHQGQHRSFEALRFFLESVPTDTPHDLFRAQRTRASQTSTRFSLSEVAIIERKNAAIEMARFVIPTVSRNTKRHETLQDFMLVNDSVTIAVEVPLFLTSADVRHFTDVLGFSIPFAVEKGATITGHIDILQIRNGMIHILDYKPDAKHDKPIEQLMVYALALSRRTGMRLYHFKCAWFDDEHYYEFYPLHVVHKRKPAA
ncbi:MAG: PD-(D/E)XK nuclease family protein [Rhodospirillales bacterium]